MPDSPAPDRVETVGARYRGVRLRLTDLLEDLDADGWETPVEACPGWRVRDVLAHLVGIIEDALAGRISGPPSDALTAEEVDRHRDDDPAALLASWAAYADGGFEQALTEGRMWPAFLDVLSHEHDVRHALGRPGEQDLVQDESRDGNDVRLAARLLADPIEVPGGIIEIAVGDAAPTPRVGSGQTYLLRAPAFEVLRLRLGRRSADQVRAMDWSQDPTPVMEHLFTFGPRRVPLHE